MAISQNQEAGFSILEVVISLTIVSLSLIGIMELATKNLQVQYNNRGAIVASQLALECTELVRNMRDANWEKNEPAFDSGLAPGNYSLDYRGAGSMTAVTGIDDEASRLKIDAAGFYTNDAAAAILTPYYRYAKITKPDDEHLSVTCEISWQEKGTTHRYNVQTLLYRWLKD